MAHAVRVHSTTWLANGVVQVEFRDPAGADLPAWEPGAHLALRLGNGMTREYSLCGDPADRRSWTVAVLREPNSRGGSSWVHERLTAGTLLEVEGPRNNFPLEPAERHLLIAGGIGVTPILAMARRLAERGADWRMVYCGRSRESMAFLPRLQELGGDRVRVHADDERGGPPDLRAELGAVAEGELVYCCGPEPLINAVESTLPDPSVLRVERFRAPEVPKSTSDESFEVVCGNSGVRVPVAPGTSVLDALAASGIDVPNSCQEGVCGTCETKVLGGEPEHRDHVLSPAEREAGDTMMICVSRCRSAELVLDL
ncbi:PDR/VanB family oxidoreductase [Saccharopolyspora sp. WRP15-2]|uniref:PDR/VanB family oxidoreductase n=1 Tax=Saccharopolyspora oryzae TaxID=2997343 RepID=A0ABT4V5Z2_9PSEU|nr:PDR/VanB family oxidoreductase [Saccharopolyspora oryzae]MDA3629363.1 PDR/VanB family oxidoreductase [Saccharopolyspora oryzae]